MIVLSHADPARPMKNSSSDADIFGVVSAAKRLGCSLYFIPAEPERHQLTHALAQLPLQKKQTPAFWSSYIPSTDYYREVYEGLRAKNISLLNTPEENQALAEFDRAYPALLGLTPESVMLQHKDECARCVEQLGLPVFVKGAVFSRKAEGWSACVAQTLEELESLVERLLQLRYSRQRVIVRRLARLKKSAREWYGFPMGREFRVFLYRGEVLSYGFYWPLFDDPMCELSEAEREAMLGVAREAAQRLSSPLASIDVGQEESGDWIVIEPGDPQFAGLGFIEPESFIRRLREVLL